MKFFNPDLYEADMIRMLRPKEKHFHFHWNPAAGVDGTYLCTGADSCPICNIIKCPKTFRLRFKIFLLDIIEAFKKLISKT